MAFCRNDVVLEWPYVGLRFIGLRFLSVTNGLTIRMCSTGGETVFQSSASLSGEYDRKFGRLQGLQT